MHYSAICIKAFGDRSNPEYYPQIDEAGDFVPERGDNSASSADFTNLQLTQDSQLIFESEHGLDGKLFITDARIVLMCKEYESGQFLWIGNPVITAIAGVASSAMAKSKTAGKVLTGHIRYEWLESVVSASEKLLLNFTDETIVFNYRDPFNTACSLTVSLKNTAGIAGKIEAEIQKRRERQSRQHMSVQEKPGLPAIGATVTPEYKYCTACGERIKALDLYCKHCGVKQART